jgi:peptidyl-Lys metalloendopeptidase
MSRNVGKWLLVIALAVLCGPTWAAAAPVGGLTAAIEAEKSFLTGGDHAVVRVALTNGSAQDLYVPYWQTPLRGVTGNLFDVRLNGQPVAYTGRLTKWGPPQAEDYVRIPAGQELAVSVDLSRHYDLTRTGEYTVQLRTQVQDALRGTGTKIVDLSGLRELASNVVALGIERDAHGRLVQSLVQTTDAALDSSTDGLDAITQKYLTPGFVSCSSSRQSTLRTALGNAESISLAARNYLNNLPVASRSTDAAYRTWFGAYTSSRYSTVQSHYNNIYSTFNTKTVTFYCDCTSSAYAYVYANQPYKIHLCNAFWAAPNLGIDSKAGTLVHETSHFTVVAGTQDYAYGTSACQSLANSNPSRAVNNADSHEYFAETR